MISAVSAMDSSQNSIGPHKHNDNAFSTIDNFINGAQSYANFNTYADDSHNEFLWDPALFNNPTEQAQAFPRQTSTPSNQAWSNNSVPQSVADPRMSNHGNMHATFPSHQYAQPSYDPRPPAQQSFDPRSISRPSPSPGSHTNYPFSTTLNYRDQALTSAQSFSMQESALNQHRTTSASPSNFYSQQNYSPYFSYDARAGQHQNLQDMELGTFSAFPEPSHRLNQSTIDPSFLTANDVDMNQDRLQSPRSGMNRQRSQGAAYFVVAAQNDQRPLQHPALGNSAAEVNPPGTLMPPKPTKVTKSKAPKDPNAPKRPRGRPRKDGTMPRSRLGEAITTSASESDSDGYEIVEMPEPKPTVLNNVPPTDLEGKASYDVIQAVWSPRNKPAIPDNVRRGIAMFGETVKKIRDAWKAKNESFKQAELANSTAIPSLKQEVARYRQLMETVVKKAVELGHESHLKKLGENPFTLSAFQALLADRVMAGDFDGSLVTNILKLVVKFKTMDEDMLEKTKTSRILVRLTKKAGTGNKNLAQAILDNAAVASKDKLISPASGPDSPKSVIGSQAILSKVDPIAGTKRPRELESSTLAAIKRPVAPSNLKVVQQASKPLALQNAERKRADSMSYTTKTVAPQTGGGGANPAISATAKPKVAVVAPLKVPNNVFSSLMSASKKPGTSLAARAAAAKDKASSAPNPQKESPPPITGPAPTPKPSFSFMDTLADMNKPKEVEQKKVDDRPPETEEERRKRVRKEERKKLRVSWRPDESLVEVKVFTHDPEEESGRADSTMRDVDDVGGEGRMLKLHKELDDLDDEEEATGEDLEPYISLSEVDFSRINPEERKRQFIKYGGIAIPDSPEREAQARREETTLMVVYSLPSDQPSTPKEPPAAREDEDYSPVTSFGDPEQKTRSREETYFAARSQNRLAQTNACPTPDLGALLQGMQQQQLTQQHLAGVSDLEHTFGMFAGQQQMGQQPPTQPVAGGLDLAKIVAVLNANKQLQAQQGQPQFPTPVPSAQPAMPNLAVLLNQLQGQQPQQTATLPFGLNGNPNPYLGSDNDFTRKHARTKLSGNEYDNNNERGFNKKKKGGFIGKDKYKTVVCKFWQEGKCLKGDDCTYRHDEG